MTAFIVVTIATMPEVIVDESGNCISVTPAPAGTCDRLPNGYIITVKHSPRK